MLNTRAVPARGRSGRMGGRACPRNAAVNDADAPAAPANDRLPPKLARLPFALAHFSRSSLLF